MNYPHRLIATIVAALGFLGSLTLGSLAVDAEAAVTVIFPINKTTTPMTMKATGPTISILNSSGVDITDSWLPEPGQSVTIRVNGVPNPSVTLVPPPTGLTFPGSFQTACSPTPCTPTPKNPFLDAPTKIATTSAYPEICTNYPSRFLIAPDTADLSADFTVSGTGNTTLTAKDCGGMAVITVGAETYILPQDSDFDGIPDIWEKVNGDVKDPVTQAVTCRGLNPAADDKSLDTDCPTASGGQTSDGIAAFDEYRGFMVSPNDLTSMGVSRDASGNVTFFGGVNYTDAGNKVHKHIRTDPRQRDVFVHLVNPQCVPGVTPNQSPAPPPSTFLTSQLSLIGGGPINFLPTDGTTLLGAVNTLVSQTQIHPLDFNNGGTNYTTNEWVDNLISYAKVPTSPPTSPTFGFSYKTGTNATLSDRQINQWAIFPVLDTVTRTTIQKGLRIVECIDTTVATPTGIGGYGSADGPGYAVLYTQRIADFINKPSTGLIPLFPTYKVRYVTWQNGAKLDPTLTYTRVDPVTGARTTGVPIDATYIISKSIQFYMAMEVGHAVKLLTDPNNIHTPTGSGDNMDGTITNKAEQAASGSPSCPSAQFSTGCNTFYVPSTYSSGDLTAFKIRN